MKLLVEIGGGIRHNPPRGDIMERLKRVPQSSYDLAVEEGWGEFECCHGYGIFEGEYTTHFGIIQGQHIERIDIMNVWNSDIEAAQHAENNEGIKIIRDIPNLYKVFIDTPENRANIMKQIGGKNNGSKSQNNCNRS